MSAIPNIDAILATTGMPSPVQKLDEIRDLLEEARIDLIRSQVQAAALVIDIALRVIARQTER